MKKLNVKSWEEFRTTGLLWFINMNLHVFGWALVTDVAPNGEVLSVYPARTKFRGFSENDNTKGYEKVTKYLNDNSVELLKDVLEE